MSSKADLIYIISRMIPEIKLPKVNDKKSLLKLLESNFPGSSPKDLYVTIIQDFLGLDNETIQNVFLSCKNASDLHDNHVSIRTIIKTLDAAEKHDFFLKCENIEINELIGIASKLSKKKFLAKQKLISFLWKNEIKL